MAGLRALTYLSEAISPLTRPQIEHLLKRAEARNGQHGVTGVLLYTNGHFIQYIEGPAEGVATIWDIIQADPLHHRIVELAHEPIREREFAQWSMAFRADGSHGMSHPTHLDALLTGRCADYGKALTGPTEKLLHFWNAHRGQSAF
ncbi:MAG: BLUF domain-containing protein [Hydrogenophaga sp.]|uniref:BLUF domain-containing protein n=1 Tax=Hydrogenophaga sp. TaxID=1904254 RepID=UPI0026262A4F|nr:BLUF domain-containing protein [Hydrogenophaga sp.]MDM7942260.1 BLUF domain-containing protein [Hydrogenophaga sp.]